MISTGGRLMLDPQNVASLSRNGRVFCLVATPDEIFDRVTNDGSAIERPLLAVPDPRQRIVELLAERSPEYRRFAQLTTDTVSAAVVAADLAVLASAGPAPLRHRQSERWVRVHRRGSGAAVPPSTRPHRRSDGGRDEHRGRRPVPGELRRCRRGGHAARAGRAAEEPGRRAARLRRPARRRRRSRRPRSSRSATPIVGDVAGFVAATYFRGLDLVHCPTDLIAMIDTSIGGKVGLDVPQGKNLIGLFKQPRAVVADVATLQTLSRPAVRVRDGRGRQARPHRRFRRCSPSSRAGEWHGLSHEERDAIGRLQTLVAQAIQVKIAIVQDDPFEAVAAGRAQPRAHVRLRLRARRWSDALNHGEAVGIGLVAAARLSEQVGMAAPGLGRPRRVTRPRCRLGNVAAHRDARRRPRRGDAP